MVKRSLRLQERRVRARTSTVDLVSLPQEVLVFISTFLSATDMTNLSCVSRQYRNELRPLVLRKIKNTWSGFSSDKLFMECHRLVIEQARIIDHSSYGEWQVNFEDFFKGVALKHLLVNSNSSSNWLKYRSQRSVQELSLYLEDGMTSLNPRIFSLHHIVGFENLRKLRLWSYHFNWEGTCGLALQELSVFNCTWEYPFQLSQFDLNGSIRKLELAYDKLNSFVLSERLNQFLINDFDCMPGLRSMSVSVQNLGNCELFLPLAFFSKFIDLMRFPHLTKLLLLGCAFNIENLMYYFRTAPKEKVVLQLFKMLLVHPKQVVFAEQVAKLCMSRHPAMRVELALWNNER